MRSLDDQRLNLQQYRYRRKYPYNDTIREESDESLSEVHSLLTAESGKQFIFSEEFPKARHWKQLSMDERETRTAFLRLTPRDLQVENYVRMKSKTLISENSVERDTLGLASYFRKKKDKENQTRVIRSFDDLPVEVKRMEGLGRVWAI